LAYKEGLADHRNLHAAAVKHGMRREDILIPVAVLDIAGQKRKAEPLGQFRHAVRAIGEIPMADHGIYAQGLLHRDHIGGLRLQICPGALPGIAAI